MSSPQRYLHGEPAGQHLVTLRKIDPGEPLPTRQRATFRIVAGLANPSCYSFRGPDNRYLRHRSFLMRLEDSSTNPSTFNEDATFCPHAGAEDGSVRLESHNYPGYFVRVDPDGRVSIAADDGSSAFKAASSFWLAAPLAP